MKNVRLNRDLQRIRWLIDKTQAVSADELELQGHWGRYLCVLVAGLMENSIGEIYADYARKSANKSVSNYVAISVTKIQNPNSERFEQTARLFSARWADSLQAFMAEAGRKEALDAIMANRHLIVHGRDSGITVARVNEYLSKCVDIVEFLEDQCGSTSSRT